MTYDVIRSCAESDKASVVEVAADGHLKTSTASGSANILITSHEDFGLKQTAIFSVEVRFYFTSVGILMQCFAINY